ncbi:bis(5'-adenosyl)-triphosphatase enpp4-like [Condylostylus longicornis]|uniref:bis(5'-adenosyl)-triphosphatase enpp4-like n=1 Tax=Condylostylus longicornis TaxID=2530218 RepID=UPI00244E237C|nr:bis(5'-adenosyl)-triphosphatase enpp4-like [Condylostylus longicornis]
MKKILILIIYLYNVCYCVPVDVVDTDGANNNETKIEEKQILIIISYDGFRNEYLHRNVTPNMLDFRENGAYADYMKNVFPTKTFTNHHSIATGLYPDKHGVLANSLYDTEKGPLKYSYDLFHFNPEVVPIWILNQQYGGKSACVMWPGSNFEYLNQTCHYTMIYNTSVPFNDRVDQMITWLTKETDAPNLVMFYSEQPDKLAHMVGPDSSNITDMVEKMDLLTKYIQDELAKNNLINRTNVIHLSDHGMASTSQPYFINITDYLEPDTYKYYGTSPVLQIVPEKEKYDDVYERLKNASIENKNFKIYTNENLLERWHANNTRRLGPIILVAEYGYAFDDMYILANHFRKENNVPFTMNSSYGVHGYDNEYDLMHAYFMAKGPQIKSNFKLNPFETVDLYELFIKLLQIDDVKLNYKTSGSYSRVSGILIENKSYLTNIIVSVVLAAIVIVLLIIYAVHQVKKRQNYNVNI